MTVIFFIPLSMIALYEARREAKRGSWLEYWLFGGENGMEDSPQIRNPEIDDPKCPGKQISKVPFEELIKVFPNTTQQVCLMTRDYRYWTADNVTSRLMRPFWRS